MAVVNDSVGARNRGASPAGASVREHHTRQRRVVSWRARCFPYNSFELLRASACEAKR